jgi:alpha-glucosidase
MPGRDCAPAEDKWIVRLKARASKALLFFVWASTAGPLAMAQTIVLNRVDSSIALQNGIKIDSGPGLLRILALRDGVVRITMSPTKELPENTSWAALVDSRNSSVGVTPEEDVTSVGFDTPLLHVRVSRSSLAISITDGDGRIIINDAQPVEFRKDDRSGDIGFRVWKVMPEDEHYFGLGEKAGPLDRRGGAFVQWNTDASHYEEGTDPLYDSIPFFVADRAGDSYGLFLDNTWRTEFDFGKSLRDQYSFSAEGGPLDYYVLYGPSPKQVVEDYAWLTGTTPLPPLWSFGYQQSRWSYGTEKELRAIARRLRADHIPSDVVYMDIDYQVKRRPFTIDTSEFPNFSSFVDELRRMQFHLILITDLHLAYLPNQSYAPFNSGVAGNHFLKNPDGSLYVGKVWPGQSVFPNFVEKSAREWWGSLYKSFYDSGVAGFWNDMNEPSVFDSPTKTIPLDVRGQIEEPGFQKRTATQREIHNIMGMQNARATDDGLSHLKPNQRPFVLTRATYAGGQRYGATWTGDNSSTWAQLRMSTPMLESLGLCGFYMAGDDIGGYAGSPPMDLLTKWFEVGTFNPMERDHKEHETNPQEPWVGGTAQEAVRRHYIDQRYRLMPYIYTMAENASRTGIPIMRPLFLEFPDATPDRHPLDLDVGNEFLFGSDLLIAPAPHPDQVEDYAVIFPPVPWYDYWTGLRVTHAEPFEQGKKSEPTQAQKSSEARQQDALESISVHPMVDVLPVFVRGGSILPIQPLIQNTEQMPKGPLELNVYPGPDCKGTLYEDDGTSLNYKRGDYLRVNYTCEVQPKSIILHIATQSGTFRPWWKTIEVSVFDWPSARVRAFLNAKPVASTNYDAAHHVLHITVPQSFQATDLMVKAMM